MEVTHYYTKPVLTDLELRARQAYEEGHVTDHQLSTALGVSTGVAVRALYRAEDKLEELRLLAEREANGTPNTYTVKQ